MGPPQALSQTRACDLWRSVWTKLDISAYCEITNSGAKRRIATNHLCITGAAAKFRRIRTQPSPIAITLVIRVSGASALQLLNTDQAGCALASALPARDPLVRGPLLCTGHLCTGHLCTGAFWGSRALNGHFQQEICREPVTSALQLSTFASACTLGVAVASAECFFQGVDDEKSQSICGDRSVNVDDWFGGCQPN